MAIQYDKMPKGEVRAQYPYLWETVQKEFPQLGEDDLEKVMWMITGTCTECFEEPSCLSMCQAPDPS